MIDNSAYDYEMFMPAKERVTVAPEIEVRKLPKKKKSYAEEKALATKATLKRYVPVLAAAIILLGGFVATKAYYFELCNQCSDKQSDLKDLQSAYVCLEVEYESNSSVGSIEDYAINVLHMQHPDANQIKYIKLAKEDNYKSADSGKAVLGCLASPLLAK